MAALTTNDVWIGYVQSAGAASPADRWQWIDGTPTGYTDWFMLEPNDVDDVEDSDEDCVTMFDGGPWNDKTCAASHPFVCAR